VYTGFGLGKKYIGVPRRFKRTIYAIDSTTIELIAQCIDWAKHRRYKATLKCHMSLNVQTFLPSFVVLNSARTHDARHARELCAHMKAGEIVVGDKAYIDFTHLYELTQRDISWVVRAKNNMKYSVKKS